MKGKIAFCIAVLAIGVAMAAGADSFVPLHKAKAGLTVDLAQ